MSSVTLASGVQLPMVGFGCAGYVRRHELLQAIHAGYRMFDTAQAHEWYLEEELGAAWQASGVGRTELFFTSKLHPRDLGEQSTLDAFPNSLRRLNTTYLDAFLLHYPRCFGTLCAQPPQGTWKDSWRALEKLFADGRVRAIGVSNFSPQELEELLAVSTVKPHLVQSWMDPLHQERPLRSLCRRHNIQFQVHLSRGGAESVVKADKRMVGLSVGLFDSGYPAPYVVQPCDQAPGLKLYRQGSRQKSRSGAGDGCNNLAHPPQVALRWALQHDAAVIPRSRNPGRMRANLELSEWQLSAEHMAAIDALDGSDPTLITLPLSPPLPCKDEEPGCARWAEDGECEKNPGFMLRACAGSCNSCHARDREL